MKNLPNRRTARLRPSLLRPVLLGAAGAWLALGAAIALAAQPGGHVLHIAAAADLEPVLPSVLAEFQKETGVRAEATYKSSAVLAQQLINGAPEDVFFAADTGFPQKVIDAGMALESSPVPYARGTLVLWAHNGQPLLQGKPVTLTILHSAALQSVAVANPEHAPYGRAAQAAIRNMHLDEVLQPKLRIAANIAQAAQYAESGNAQVGFLSLTSARTPLLASTGTYVTVPPNLYPPLLQAAVITKSAADRADAERLLAFLHKPRIRALLALKGLSAPQ
jgi:molybdate transport system substrate-binding protein